MEATLRGKSPFCNLFCLTCVHAKLFQSCSTLCNSRDCSPYGFSVLGDLQSPGIKLASFASSALVGVFFTTRVAWEVPSAP